MIGMLIYSNELLSFVTTGDTLIIDGQVIYLDQDTLTDLEKGQFNFDADYRRLRKKGIWGLEANMGLQFMSNVPVPDATGHSSVYGISPNFKKKSWGSGFGAEGYYHFQDHFALRAGIELQQINWKTMVVEDVQNWNQNDIYDAAYNGTGLQAFYRVLVDTGLGLYELDTLTLQPKLQANTLESFSVPVMAAFHLNGEKKRYQKPNMFMLEMGAVYQKLRVEAKSFTVLSETHELITLPGLSRTNWSRWSMRSAFTWKRLMSKKGMNALFVVARAQMDWPAGQWEQSDWQWKLPASYLTFGMLWERGKSLHSLNN